MHRERRPRVRRPAAEIDHRQCADNRTDQASVRFFAYEQSDDLTILALQREM